MIGRGEESAEVVVVKFNFPQLKRAKIHVTLGEFDVRDLGGKEMSPRRSALEAKVGDPLLYNTRVIGYLTRNRLVIYCFYITGFFCLFLPAGFIIRLSNQALACPFLSSKTSFSKAATSFFLRAFACHFSLSSIEMTGRLPLAPERDAGDLVLPPNLEPGV